MAVLQIEIHPQSLMLGNNPKSKRSSGIVVLRRVAVGWRVLLLRAFRNWDFPKGLIAPGEDPLTAALREAREETGLTELTFT